MKKKLAILAIALAITIAIGSVAACTYFFNLPINGIGYFDKPKEETKVLVQNVTEHITCPNGFLHLEFYLNNTDGAVQNVELWIYFRDGANNGGNVLEERYLYIGNMIAHEVRRISIDVLFSGGQSELGEVRHEGFSIHYTR